MRAAKCYQSPHFLYLPYTHIQRLLLHLAIHHHKDSKPAFVLGSVLGSGGNSQLAKHWRGDRHPNTLAETKPRSQESLVDVFFGLALLCLIKFISSSMFYQVRGRKLSGKQERDEHVLQVQLPLWVSCQVASCLQLRDELSAALGGGQLGDTGTSLFKTACAKQKSPWPPETSAGFWEESFILLFRAVLTPEGSSDEQQSQAERADSLKGTELNLHDSFEDWISKNKSQNNVWRSLSNTYSDSWRCPTLIPWGCRTHKSETV